MSSSVIQEAGDVKFMSSPKVVRKKSNKIERIRRKLTTAVTIGKIFGRSVQLVYKNHYERFTTKDAVVVAVTDRYAILQGSKSIPQDKIQKVIF
tara:strand:- start:245 stop:526 length:282 start_codon:yes stop_codon:yes gene_type:complete